LADDSLRGGAKSVELYGGDGNDTIYGGDGNDTLSGEAGSDILVGGKGQDVYSFGVGSGDDVIVRDGVNSNSEDILRITGDPGMLTFRQAGNDMELELATEDSLVIQGWYEQPANRIHNIILGNDAYAVIVGEDENGAVSGNDTLTGTANDDQLYGLTGNDLLLASGGNDVYGFNVGDGNDTLDLTTGSSSGQAQLQFGTGISKMGLLVENAGEDLLIHTSETDSLTLKGWASYASQVGSIQFADGGKYYNSGIAGDDGFVNGDLRDNFVAGSEEDDFIASIGGNDLIFGGGGNDTLYGGAGADIMHGGSGNDVICLDDVNLSGDSVLLVDGGNEAGTRDMVTAWRFGSSLGPVTIDISDETKFVSIEDIAGSVDCDTLIGNSGANILYGKLPSEPLSSAGDYFDGRAGSDTIYGGAAGDIIVYDSEDSGANIHAGRGTDILDAGNWQTGANIAMADYCHNEADKIEQVIGTAFADSIQGSDWDDGISGGAGNDFIDGGKGNDALTGGEGDDSIIGGEGNDALTGGEGDDSLVGGAGNDSLIGGAGNDVYYWSSKTALSGNDTIAANDYNAYDCVVFGEGVRPANLAIALSGNNLIITAQSGETLTLQNWAGGYESAITQFYFQADKGWCTIDPVSLLWTVSNAGYIGGGSGSDDLTVHYGNYSDGTLTGNDADEIFYGGQGNEQILGGLGNDVLDGGGGVNTLSGGAGSDSYYFTVDGGNDLITDNADNQSDAIVFANGISPADIEFTRQGNDLVMIHSNGIDKMTVQNFYTAAQPINTFVFGGVSYNMYANDMQASPAGEDDSGNSLVGNLDNNIILGMGGDDYLFGLDGADILCGGDGNDYLYGYNGADYMFGGAGNDMIYYASDVADKWVDGGDGRDTILGAQQINLSDAGQFANIEDIIGSGKNDELTGSAGDNNIWGYNGADTLNGAAGNDSIWSGDVYLPDVPEDNSYDAYPNNMSNDAIVDDVIVFDNQAGNEYISGGGGADILDASGETAGVNIDLSDFAKYNSVEFVIGGSGNDYIYGGNESYEGYFWDEVIGNAPAAQSQMELNWIHKLEGGAGSDTLDAGNGNDDFKRINFLELDYGVGLGRKAYDRLYYDHINGGDYQSVGWHGNDVIHTADTLAGGAGRDFYVFGHGYGNDVIASDSQNCEDVIWLNNDIVVDAGNDLNDFIKITFWGTNDKDMVISLIDGQADSLDLDQYYAANDDVERRDLIGASSHLTITDGAVDYSHAILQFSALVDDGVSVNRQYFALTPGMPNGFVFHSIK
jgi:Ca2+-binding RTX toxin-like protein